MVIHHRTMLVGLVVGVWLTVVQAWDPQPDGYEVIDGPRADQNVETWRREWTQWKRMELMSARYDPQGPCTIYNRPDAAWTQRNLVQAFVMLHDRHIFDRKKHAFTPELFIGEMEARIGKLDSVFLWSSYPNIGIDGRNQWDYLRAGPGGLQGLQDLIKVFHRHDIRVFVPYNPWDTATRDEDGLDGLVRMYQADAETLKRLIPELDADGFNGDTMYGVPPVFFNCSHPLISTPEGGVPSAALAHNPISWGYFWGYSSFPPVARAKFLESRHMVQICARWSLDRMTELQMAFFNGVGYVVWENVWGIWNGMTEQESEATKRVFHVLRAFTNWTTSAAWVPHAFRSNDQHVVGSVFPHRDKKLAARFVTLVNVAKESQTIDLPLTLAQEMNIETVTTEITKQRRVFDVYKGVELVVASTNASSVKITLEPRGFGAVLITSIPPESLIPKFGEYLEQRQNMTRSPLTMYSSDRPLLRQKMTRTSTVPWSSQAESQPSADAAEAVTNMIRITGNEKWWFNVSGVQIEPVPAWTPNWADYGTGVQFPWEDRPWNNHSVELLIRNFSIGKYPTTNAEFFKFLHDSKYEPATRSRFLEHWNHRVNASTGDLLPIRDWQVPAGFEQSPVVYVSYEDARSFAEFYHKRLLHDWEWQYVASNGAKYTRYPWGSQYDASKLPKISREKQPPLPNAVGTHPKSRSMQDGVEDLVGFVWQMTDQFCDDHTCGILLRGGSYYRPIATTLADPNWYFPQALESTQHNRLLQYSEGADRSPMVGFRCAQSMP